MGGTRVRNVLDLPETEGPSDGERLEALAAGRGVRVERIVSRGHASPEGFWYDQETEEWVLVVSGRAELEVAEGDPTLPSRVVPLGPGDFLTLPAGCRHRVRWTTPDEPTVWLAVHYPPAP